MQCELCPYQSPNPQDVFRHMIQAHGMTQQNTPPYLSRFWQNNSPNGYYEAPNPITGIAKEHQLNAQRAQTVSVFNPNPCHRTIIQPTIVPEPWKRVEDNYYVVNEDIVNEPLRKVIVSGKMTRGHGKVEVFKSETHEKHGLIETLTGKTATETIEDVQTLEEEFRPFTRSIEYREWEQKFMDSVASKINLLKNNVLGTVI